MDKTPSFDEIVNAVLAQEVAEKEALQLALICAEDIVKAWPSTTMRTLGQMTKRIDTLRQALEAAGRLR